MGHANPNDRLIMDSEMNDLASSIHLPTKKHKEETISDIENLVKVDDQEE